jgi:hypothetical protein
MDGKGGRVMENKQLEEKIAELEFINDQLISEYKHIDHLLQAIGFPCGLASLKEVGQDLIEEKNENGINF